MKRVTLSFVIVFLLLSLASCGGSSFIDDGNGHKQYKDSSGNFVKNDWAEIKGKRYFFDMNGYLVTNQWVQDEYYVGDNGAMQTNYWHDDNNGKMYYLGEDGKYVKGTTMTIDGNEYAFKNSGELVKNAPYVSNNVGYYFGNDGKIDKNEGYKNVNGTYCYVKEDGSLLLNDWKEDEGKWYYFNDMGLMLKNSFVDGGYYVDENGEMVKDREIIIGGETYKFNNEGKSKAKTISFIELKNKYCKNEYTTYDGTKYDWGLASEENAKATSTTLELFGKGSMEIEIMMSWIENINKELALPQTLYRQIANTAAIDGIQKERFNKVLVTWYVEVTAGYAGGYGKERCLSVFYELV